MGHNNGTCLQSVSGFTCACRGDFTGETCETRINDCQDVDCNDGTCVDGIQSFTCQCDPGFTGESCEEGITTSVPTTTTTTPDGTTSMTSTPDDATSSNVDATLIGVVAGTTVGVVLLVAILITIICIICIKVASGTSVLAVIIQSCDLLLLIGSRHSKTEGAPISPNLAYGICPMVLACIFSSC